MGESSAQQRMEQLAGYESNKGTVDAVATGGHVISTGISLAAMGNSFYGALAAPCAPAFGTVLLNFAAPVGAALAGGMLGASIGNWAGNALMDSLGIGVAKPGEFPACVGHKIVHNNAFLGALVGIVAGVVAGVVVGAAIIGTGGAAAGLLLTCAAAGGGAFVGGLIGGFCSAVGKKWATETGKIMTGSPNVTFEGRPVARVTDVVECKKDIRTPPPMIAEGSLTISVNSLPLARIGHKINCSAVIQEGCKTISADLTTGQFGPINADVTVAEQFVLSATEVFIAWDSTRANGWQNKFYDRIRQNIGEPVDAGTGFYFDYRTDFHYPHTLPLSLTRYYCGHQPANGQLGQRWLCNWSEQLLFSPDGQSVTYFDAEDQRPIFTLRQQQFNGRNHFSPHLHLYGTRERTLIFDETTQLVSIFSPTDVNSHTSRLVAIKDRNHNQIHFDYNRQGQLYRVRHSSGFELNIITTATGEIERVLDADQATLIQYSYQSDAQQGVLLTDVRSRLSGEFHYTYNPQGWMDSWRDTGPTLIHINYDQDGRVIATRTPQGLYNDQFRYSPAERKTEYINALGAITTMWFDDQNLLVKSTDPLGRSTLYQRNEYGQITSIINPAGRTSTLEYDRRNRLCGVSDDTGRRSRYEWEEFGLLTRYQNHRDEHVMNYDAQGNLTQQGINGSTHHYRYTPDGQLKAHSAPDGTTEQWHYTQDGALAAYLNPLHQRTSYTTDRYLRITSVTSSEGNRTEYDYEHGEHNPRAALSLIRHPDGGTEQLRYDGEGKIAEYLGAMGQRTRYHHGAFDLVQEHIDPLGCRTQYHWDNTARLTGLTNAAGQRWHIHYDAAGQLAAEEDWAGRRTVFERDILGRLTVKTLPDGSQHHYRWDEFDRLTEIRSGNQRHCYIWDKQDRLTGALTWEQDHCTSHVELAYDRQGRLTEDKQNGQTIHYTYDLSGRPVRRESATGTLEWQYDAAGQLVDYRSNGHRLHFKHSATGQETLRAYQPLDLAQATACSPLNQLAFAQQQRHDPCGRLTEQRHLQYALIDSPATPARPLEQAHIRYQWDKSSRLLGSNTTEHGALTARTRYRYDARDQINAVECYNGLATRQEHYAHDALGHLSESGLRQSLNTHHYQGDCVRQAGNTTYQYDARGRMTSRSVHKDGFRPQTWHFRWDEFDHLRQVRTPQGEVWAYTYDALGRRISKQCIEGGARISTVSYLWQGSAMVESHRIYADGTPELTQTTHYKPGSFEAIAQEQHTTGREGSEFFPVVIGPDGAPSAIYTSTGRRVWQADKQLWGRTDVRASLRRQIMPGRAVNDESMIDCDLRFMGQWYDEESGLHYNLHRYYDPQTGQYLSTDPLGLAGGLNTHAYVHDPVNWCDPWGLQTCPPTTNGSKADDIIDETLNSKGNVTSKHTVSSDELLQAGEKFLGPGYKEIGKPGSGVFRSLDGTRQFRIDNNSISGNHAPGVPHGHPETYPTGGNRPITNNHIPFKD